MIVREEKITWVIREGNLYKQTELVTWNGGKPGPEIIAPKWTSEYLREATEQDRVGNV